MGIAHRPPPLPQNHTHNQPPLPTNSPAPPILPPPPQQNPYSTPTTPQTQEHKNRIPTPPDPPPPRGRMLREQAGAHCSSQTRSVKNPSGNLRPCSVQTLGLFKRIAAG